MKKNADSSHVVAQQHAAKERIQHESETTVHDFDPSQTPQAKRTEAERHIPADMLPDFRNLGNKRGGLYTELGSSDVAVIKEALSAAQQKPVIAPVKTTRPSPGSAGPGTPRTPRTPATATATTSTSSRVPEWYRVGWTAFSNLKNPGGPSQLAACEKKPDDPWAQLAHKILYADYLERHSAIFAIGFVFWLLGWLGGGLITLGGGLLFVATYYQISYRRFERHARDDIARELIKTRCLEDDTEPVEWLNSFLQKFWLIFEPVLSAYVIENIDTYLVDYLPSFLDSVRLTTFTLGTKPFRIESVRWLQESSADTVCMDWSVAFRPNDLSDMTQKQLDNKVNPKVMLSIRLGKGMVGAGIPVLVEDMSFKGQMRVKLQFMSKFPHVKVVEACFMKKPLFDYVLKPIGGETFGFDVTNIPGLQSFVRDQVHAILGPMMYYPNKFAFDVEKFFSGELDITQANGVLAVTVYSASIMNSADVSGQVNPYIRFYLDKAQELGRTNAQENTLEPRWNETHFLLLNNLNSMLSLEMRNESSGFKDRRIARAHFFLKEMDNEDDYGREGVVLNLKHNAKPIGELKADFRYMPVSKPIPRDDGTIEPAAESNSGILRFTVHECRNLGSTRLNPYVRVLVNGAERIQTPVFRRNPNPKFERPGEVVVLDQTAVYIRVEVKDSISFAEDTTLGVWKSYLVDMMQMLQTNDGWWDLTHDNGTKAPGRIRLGVQWKPVLMTNLSQSLGGQGFFSDAIGVVRITFWRARDLKNVEGVTSKSDPYVRVLSGAKVRARTEVIDNNLDPEWGETLYVPVHSVKEDLVFEVMDWNAKTKDKSLGFTVLHMKDLVRQKVDEDEDQKWYESTGRKVDQWSPLRSSDRKSTKGELQYTAEFHPVLALPEKHDDDEENENEKEQEDQPEKAEQDMPTSNKEEEIPIMDLHNMPVKYTPDDLVDLFAYNSGILKVKIHEVKLPRASQAYCQLLVDALMPQYQTKKLKGKTLTFNESCDAFVKEADFSRVAIEIKPGDADEKDDLKLGYWVGAVSHIVRQIQAKRRAHRMAEDAEDEGEWYDLLGTTEPEGYIRLSFDYLPLADFTLNPDESLDNQGQLTVTLLGAKNLMAADKSGTSDPYVVFTVNGERVHKSATIKKALNPVWKDEQFVVPIQSRVNASFRIEVFDWNQFSGDVPLGSGGISLRGDLVQSFVAREVRVPLDGVAGVSGHVRVRFLWQPQLLIRKKTHTSVLGTQRSYTNLNPSPTTSRNTLSPQDALLRSKTTSAGTGAAVAGGAKAPPVPAVPGPKMTSPSPSTSMTHIPTQQPSTELKPTKQQQHSRSASLASTLHRRSIDTVASQDPHASHQIGDDTATGLDGVVVIHLIEAQNLRGVDKSGTSDPYVRVRMGKSQVYKTKHIKKTLRPEWNEWFRQPVSSQPTMIDFKVKDYNRFSHSVELGQCQWNIWDLLRPQQEVLSVDKWLPLYPLGHGELHVKIEYLPSR